MFETYRVERNPWFKGSVPVLFCNFHHGEERGEQGGSANSRTKHTEHLTQGFCSPLYTMNGTCKSAHKPWGTYKTHMNKGSDREYLLQDLVLRITCSR